MTNKEKIYGINLEVLIQLKVEAESLSKAKEIAKNSVNLDLDRFADECGDCDYVKFVNGEITSITKLI